MASPTIYKWTDPGAPQITRGKSAEYQAMFQAVLIDGYGAKTPPVAGVNKWSIPFSTAAGFILKQGGTKSRKACLKFESFNSNSTYAEMEAAEDYTDFTTPVNRFAGETNGDRLGVGYSSNNSYRIPWIIIATERAIYCQFGYNSQEIDTAVFDTQTSNINLSNHHFFFGDYVPENPAQDVNQLVCFTNYTSTASAQYCQNLTFTTGEGYGKKRILGNAVNFLGSYPTEFLWLRGVSQGALVPGGPHNVPSVPTYPNQVNGGLYLDKVRMVSQRVMMGEMPGMLFPIQAQPFSPNHNMIELDGVGDYTGEKLYVFGTANTGTYIIRDGEWGVE